MLNDPITEKNKATYKKVMDMRINGQNKKKEDRIGRFRPKFIKKQLYF